MGLDIVYARPAVIAPAGRTCAAPNRPNWRKQPFLSICACAIATGIQQEIVRPANEQAVFSTLSDVEVRVSVTPRVADARLNAVASSPPVIFYIRHASKLYPNRKGA